MIDMIKRNTQKSCESCKSCQNSSQGIGDTLLGTFHKTALRCFGNFSIF